MMFVWAFSAGGSKSKSNFFKAYLIWMLISSALVFIIMLIFGAGILSLIASFVSGVGSGGLMY